MSDHVHHAVDIGAIAALFGVLIGVLPTVTTVIVFVVAVIRFFETKTVQAALKRLKKWRSG